MPIGDYKILIYFKQRGKTFYAFEEYLKIEN